MVISFTHFNILTS